MLNRNFILKELIIKDYKVYISNNLLSFCFRLLASTSSDLCLYWITKESLLLRHRLDNILPKQLHRLLKQIIWKMQIFKNEKTATEITLIELCKFYSQPLIFKHLISNCHDCTDFQYEGEHYNV